MKTATLPQIKKELLLLDKTTLINTLLRVGKHKKENKELLHYLLFEMADEKAYIASVKEEVTLLSAQTNTQGAYYANKGFRKILRIIGKHIRYSGQKSIEIELRMYFCNSLHQHTQHLKHSQSLHNLMEGQIKKIEQCMKQVHEDFRLDFKEEWLKIKELT